VPSKLSSGPGLRWERTAWTPSGFGLQTSPVGFPHTRSRDFRQLRPRRLPLDLTSSPEWQVVDLATSLYGKALVPLYDNFGPDSVGGCC
jgi:hypothetical protein